MDLVRSWLGQALRATGAAVVLPVAVLVALSLSGVGGAGLGGLGALSQIVSGPRVAGSDVVVDDGGSEISQAVTALASTSTPGGGGSTAGAGGSGSGRSGGDTGAGERRDRGGDPGDGRRGDPSNPREPRDPDDPEPDPPGPEPPPPKKDPGVVEGVGEEVMEVGSGTPAAPTIEDAVDTLVEVCGRLGCP